MSQIQLTLSENYVKSWDYWEAVRELLQNGLDQEIRDNTNVFSFEAKDINSDLGLCTLYFHNKYGKLDPGSLVMGYSDKDENQVGQFGEGYKLALLVLTRLGVKVTIHNQTDAWGVVFKQSRKLKTRLLTITMEKNTLSNNGLTIIVEGVPISFLDELKDKWIGMHDMYKKVVNRNFELLTEKEYQSKVFVNGLFVHEFPNEEFIYGYNFKPGQIELDRDRRSVDSFNLAYTIGKTGVSPDRTFNFNAIKKNARDMEYYFSHNTDNDLADMVFDDYQKEFGEDTFPVEYCEYEEFKKIPGYKPQMFDSGARAQAIINSPKYQTFVDEVRKHKIIVREPYEVLQEFYQKHLKYYTENFESINDPTFIIEAFQEILDQSENWSNS